MKKSIKEQFTQMMSERFNIKVTATIGRGYVHCYQEAFAGNDFHLLYPNDTDAGFVFVDVEDTSFILTFLIDEDGETMRMVSFSEVNDKDRLSELESIKAIGGEPNLYIKKINLCDDDCSMVKSFRFTSGGQYPVVSQPGYTVDYLCFDIYAEGEYTHSVCVSTHPVEGRIIINGWVFRNEALLLLNKRKEEERKLIISSVEGLLPFVSGDMDAAENEVVYRVEGADGLGMYHSKENGGIHAKFEIPLPGYKLINLSKEGYLFAFSSLEQLLSCANGISAKHFHYGARIKRIKYTEIVHGNCQCVVKI
jgi:hypothetical protein